MEFWKSVFSEYSVFQLIFFDPLDMTKIYEVIEVGEDNRPDGYIDGERARIAAENGVDIERVRAQRGIKERTAAGIKRSGRYIAQIQQIFSERGLPIELTYLPIVESSYDIGARSSVGAVGIWQFMPRTGREYMRVIRWLTKDATRSNLRVPLRPISNKPMTHWEVGPWQSPLTTTAKGAWPGLSPNSNQTILLS